jgi:hypothetical protein
LVDLRHVREIFCNSPGCEAVPDVGAKIGGCQDPGLMGSPVLGRGLPREIVVAHLAASNTDSANENNQQTPYSN